MKKPKKTYKEALVEASEAFVRTLPKPRARSVSLRFKVLGNPLFPRVLMTCPPSGTCSGWSVVLVPHSPLHGERLK